MRSLLSRFHHDENGATAAIIALSISVLLGFTAAAIDMSYANSTRTELQVTASSAALAGVQQIVDADENGIADNDDWRRGAVEFAYRNMAATRHGNILEATCGAYNGASVIGSSECSDIKVGDWEPLTRTFTAWDDPGFDINAMSLDAVRVRAHRNQDNGNPLALFLAPAVGLAEQEINVSAIAWVASVTGDNCYQRGIISDQWVDMDSNNTFLDGVCIYGDRGVRVQSDNCFEGPADPANPAADGQDCGDPEDEPLEYGVEVMTCEPGCEDGPGEWDEQGGPNPGFEDAQNYGDQNPALAEAVADFIGAAETGFEFGDWEAPGTIPYNYEAFADPCAPATVCGPAETSIPESGPVPGTMYDLRGGDADIPVGDWRDIAIWADTVKLQSDSSLANSILIAKDEIVVDGDVRNSVLASGDLLKFGSNIVIGNPEEHCPDDINVAAYSLGKFTIQSNTTVANTQLVTGYSVDVLDLQSNNQYLGVTIQSNGNINLGSNNLFEGCPTETLEGPLSVEDGLIVRLVD